MTSIAAEPAAVRRGRRPTTVAALVIVLAVLAACSNDKDPAPDSSPSGSSTTSARSGYVVLGDSFSAGSGAPPYDVSEVCLVSSDGYPATVADLDVSLDPPKVRACGGAAVDQVLHPWSLLNQPAQLSDEPDPRVGLVTLTVGGNDAALLPQILACATTGCAGVSDSAATTDVVMALADELVDGLYPAMRAAYPKARLVHVGYPRLTSTADGATCPWLAPGEVAEPGRLVDVVNASLRDAAQRFGEVEFVDVGSAFAGHELCTATPWVHGVDAGPSALHPTVEGYVAIGKAIAAALGS